MSEVDELVPTGWGARGALWRELGRARGRQLVVPWADPVFHTRREALLARADAYLAVHPPTPDESDAAT